ncbi:MAG: VOC family protein [Rhodobacteraceae bacterium]|nr:VOC family protein [Paracoccaceae bacterium]
MTADRHGIPCWYELSTTNVDAAQAFYASVIGWKWSAAGMEGFDYRIASSGGDLIAGAAAGAPDAPGPGWTIYFAVANADETANAMAADGCTVLVPPTDIPNTGRFSLLRDPDGARFGILSAEPMESGEGSQAFAMDNIGHGNWNELMAGNAESALAFYGRHLGWTLSQALEMGPGMTYRIFACHGQNIGGMTDLMPGMPGPGGPFWLPYFGANGIDAAIRRVKKAGGTVLHGPHEVPGGAFIAVARDPQGAYFALVGPKKVAKR